MKLADGTVAEVGMEVTRADGTPDGYWAYYLELGRIAEIHPRTETCYVDFISVCGEDGRVYESVKKDVMNSSQACDAKYLVSAATKGYADFDEQVFLRLLE